MGDLKKGLRLNPLYHIYNICYHRQFQSMSFKTWLSLELGGLERNLKKQLFDTWKHWNAWSTRPQNPVNMIWHLNATLNYMGMGHTQKRKIFGTDCDIMINHVIIIYKENDFEDVLVCRTLDTDGNGFLDFKEVYLLSFWYLLSSQISTTFFGYEPLWWM